MTERQYVEHIRKTAEAYLDQLRLARSAEPIRRWQATKEKLSPHTAIALCDAWLAQEGRTAPKTSEGDFVAPE